MTLLDSAVWWHVYPLGALGAPIRDGREPSVVHRLPRLEPWLDHVVDLGCSGLLLGPVFGWWLSILGVGVGVWAVCGWVYEFYVGEYAH